MSAVLAQRVPSDLAQAMAKNLARVAGAMTEHGITSIVGEYHGYGDSGQEAEITFEPDQRVATLLIQSWVERYTYSEGTSQRRFELESTTLEACVASLVESAIQLSGHEGYENNEGGGGTLTITPDGHAEHEHYDIYEHREYDGTDFDAEESTSALVACSA